MGMSEKEKKILEEVEYLKERYFTFDEPVPFCGMFLYPIPARLYNEFLSSSACLTLNKNDDPNGITKTHLEYLISKMTDEKEGQAWSFRFSRLVEMVFHIDNGLKCDKCGKFMSYDELVQLTKDAKTEEDVLKALRCSNDGCDGVFQKVIKYTTDEKTKRKNFIIDGHTIDGDSFMKFRRFVMYQNLPDFKDDSWVHKEVRDDQAAKQEITSRNQGTASLERKMICISAKSNYKIEDVQKMSIRHMLMLLGVIQDAMEYEITRIGLTSGFSSLPKGQTIDHWIYKKDSGLYGKSVDAGAYTSQIKNQ